MAMNKALKQKSQGKKYGLYRVSKPSQKISQQITALQEHGCDEIIGDKGVSGRQFNRKGLNAILDKLLPGDTLVVQRLDRLGRSVYHLAKLHKLFVERDITFLSLTQGFDIRTPSGTLMYFMFAAFAQHEIDLNSERTIGGLKSRKDKGVQLGRRPILSEADIVKAATMLNSKEFTKGDVADEFDVSPRTLSRSIRGLEQKLS